MIDIKSFIAAAKCSWLKRLFDKENNGKWRQMYINELEQYGGILLFEANCSKSDLEQKVQNKFLKDILRSWAEINFESNVTEIKNQVIWNNLNINNKTIYYKTWNSKGIKYIKDIYDIENNTFYNFNNLKMKYDINSSDYLKYFSLISSIDKQWKIRLNTGTSDSPQVLNITKVINLRKPYKYLYSMHTKGHNKTVINKSENKWNNVYNLNKVDWSQVYTNPFKCTIDTRLRAFQYKFLKRILPTNVFLHKCKLVQSGPCDLCNMYNETVIHLFWE